MKIEYRIAIVLSFPATLLIQRETQAQTPATERVNVDPNGIEANGASWIGRPAVSANGRFIAFESGATNLVSGDTNQREDIFVRDRLSGTTERVSVSASGAQANGDCVFDNPISPDGRYVAFVSSATNLVSGDSNGKYDVFVRDRSSSTTERVSVATNGTQGNGDSGLYGGISMSPDGRFVAFPSDASNLIGADANGVTDVFVRDRQNGTTTRVSIASNGTEGNGASSLASISADGRFVAFQSLASNLVAGDTNGVSDVFVRDGQLLITTRVSVSAGGAQANSGCDGGSISGDGRFVSFESAASNLVAGDTNGVADVFVRDLQLLLTERVNVSTGGAEGNLVSGYYGTALSGDGRFVAFWSSASNLVAGDTNNSGDIFLRDRLTGSTERASVDSSGSEGNSGCVWFAVSSDGQAIVFESFASNLVAGDTNGVADVFIRDRGLPPPSVYCTSSTSSNGCSASIGASVNPSLALATACNIVVTSVEGQRSGILFYGINNAGFASGPWAAGSTSYLCVKPPTQRTPVQTSGGTFNACDGSFVLDWNTYQTTHPLALGNPWSVGDKVFIQAWFRDPLAVKSTNLSNAVEMTYGP